MCWDYLPCFSFVAVLAWGVGAWAAWVGKRKTALRASMAGLVVFGCFIGLLWAFLNRPPLRTMGETRLWYSFFLPLTGLSVYYRWRYKWILCFSTVLSLVFIVINLLRPEIHDKTLMPALQSPWFVPHVIIYMFSYAMLGVATLTAIRLLWFRPMPGKRKAGAVHAALPPGSSRSPSCAEMASCDDLVYVGFAFLTLGMLTGAFWAKEAWGSYWSWDPKETWAAVTWFSYLLYIHFRVVSRNRPRQALYILLVSFVFLQMCWWGINYLPAVQGVSVHVYD